MMTGNAKITPKDTESMAVQAAGAGSFKVNLRNKIVNGKLSVGVEYEGEIHRDFTLRLLTVGDEIDLSESDVPDAGFRVALMALGLVALGDIPATAIDYDLLRNQLISSDFNLLTKAQDELKKKLSERVVNGVNSDMPASGSENMVTQSQKSSPGIL